LGIAYRDTSKSETRRVKKTGGFFFAPLLGQTASVHGDHHQ
jgi:hypothetical protein